MRIVLVGTSHPGQHRLGGPGHEDHGARASCTSCAPELSRATEATVLAAGADDVLAGARVVPRRARRRRGLRARRRHAPRAHAHLPWRIVEPREAAREIAAAARGRRRRDPVRRRSAPASSTTNSSSASALLTIPTRQRVRLAQPRHGRAGRRLRAAARAARPRPLPRRRAAGAARERARTWSISTTHLEQVLDEIDFRDRTGRAT